MRMVVRRDGSRCELWWYGGTVLDANCDTEGRFLIQGDTSRYGRTVPKIAVPFLDKIVYNGNSFTINYISD